MNQWEYTWRISQSSSNAAVDLNGLLTAGQYEVQVNSTTYNEDKPGFLTLIWGKIKEIIAAAPSSEPEARQGRAIPTTVAAEDVKVGTTVRAKGQVFKIIEMDDGSILVATMGKLSKKDIEDMKAFLAKYFGGNIEHIAFRATGDLFAG